MLTIHAGLPKTGSTALQKALGEMSATEMRGVRYRGRASRARNDGFYGPSHSFQVPERADSTRTVRLLARGHHVVLSEEGFFGHPYVPNVAAISSRAAVAVSDMSDYFLGKGPFQIVVYVRAQHQWAESVYNQYLKSRSGAYGIDSTEFAKRAIDSKYFYWTQLVDDLKKHAGPERVVVRAYRPGINIIEDFLTVLDLPTPQRFLNPKYENSSLPLEQLAIRKRLNELCESVGRVHLTSWASRVMDESSFQVPGPKKSLFTEQMQDRLISIAATDWELLSSAVADTRLAEPDQFKSVAQEAQRAQIREYGGRVDDVPIDDEAIQLLFESLSHAHNHPRNLPMRIKNLAAAAARMATARPGGIPRAIIRHLQQKFAIN